MERTIVNPIWENGDDRERIRATFRYTLEDGTVQEAPAVISADSEDWEAAIAVRSLEEMDQMWADHTKRREDREQTRRQEHERQQERMKQEALFALKLEIFEVEAVKSSRDRKLKANIRRAKTQTEALLFASVLVNRELSTDE